MIDVMEAGVVGAAGTDRARTRAGEVHGAIAALQTGADAREPGCGAGPVGRLIVVVAEGCGDDDDRDGEFRGALVAELGRRYLRAVRGQVRASPAVPRVWRLVLDRWAGGTAEQARTALAGAHALIGYDLAAAAVSTATVLGRTPGRAERDVVQEVAERIAEHAAMAAGADPAAADAADGLALLCASGECRRQVENQWAVRGRPSEAERARAALDWRAAFVAEAILGCGAHHRTNGVLAT